MTKVLRDGEEKGKKAVVEEIKTKKKEKKGDKEST